MVTDWDGDDVDDRWTLRASDRALLGNKTGATRLGFAVLLKVFQSDGRFPYRLEEVPVVAVESSPAKSRCRQKPGVVMTGAVGPPRITGHKSAMPSDFASPHWTIPMLSRVGWKTRFPRWNTGQTDC